MEYPPPKNSSPARRRRAGEEKINAPQMIGLTPYPMLCRPFRAILRYAALPGLTERIKRQSLIRAMRQWLPLRL